MNLQRLTLSELKLCYQNYLLHHFPANEVRSLQSIEKLYSQGVYTAYGYFMEQQLIAYAFCVSSQAHAVYLLDYYAVVPSHRKMGIGGQFLSQLTQTLNAKGILIEVETPSEHLPKEENRTRLRRIAFYERNGALLTPIGGNVFEVHFTLMYLPIECLISDATLLEMILSLYQQMVPAHLFERFVHYQCVATPTS